MGFPRRGGYAIGKWTRRARIACQRALGGRQKGQVSPEQSPKEPFCREYPPLEEAMQKADVLIEALAWIRQFRGKVTVIKLGGSVMEDDRAMIHLLLDIVFMETVGMRPVVVHGGGAAISRAMAAAGLQPRFVQGRRYTDDATLAIVERVLAGEINEQLARPHRRIGRPGRPLNFRTTNVLFGERIELDGRDGEPLDLGHVGKVTGVDRATIENLCYAGHRAGHPLDVHHQGRPEAQRQRRHGRHGRGPGPAGRETGLPQRRQRRAPRQGRPRRRCSIRSPPSRPAS